MHPRFEVVLDRVADSGFQRCVAGSASRLLSDDLHENAFPLGAIECLTGDAGSDIHHTGSHGLPESYVNDGWSVRIILFWGS